MCSYSLAPGEAGLLYYPFIGQRDMKYTFCRSFFRRERWWDLATKFLIVCVAFGGTAFCAELLLRQFYYPERTAPPYKFRIPDPVLGWLLLPNTHHLYQTLEFRVNVDYNSHGWRDIEHEYSKGEGVFRIVVLGDSYMEAYSVNLGDAFHRQLEKFARNSGKQIEVLNLGVGGYGTLQAYLALVEEGLKYSPDLVALGFYFGNDLTNNSRTLELRATAVDLKTNSRPFLLPGSPKDWDVTMVDYEGALSRYKNATRALRSIPWWKKTVLYQFYAEGKRGLKGLLQTLLPSLNNSESNSNVESQPCKEYPEYQEAWKLTERILVRLKRDVETANAQLFVFTVPVGRGFGQKLRIGLDKATGRECFDNTPITFLADIVERNNIAFLNLGPDFVEAFAKGLQLSSISDGHWNEQGHRIAAKKVLEAMNMLSLLP